MFRTALLCLVLSLIAPFIYAQFPATQPVQLGNMYTDWYPDIKMAEDKEVFPALVSSGILTNDQFLSVMKNSVAATRPEGFRTRTRNPDFYVLLRSYKAFKIAEWVWTSPINSTYTMNFALVWVPQKENRHMPADMQPTSAEGMFLVVKPNTLTALKTTNSATQPKVANATETAAVKEPGKSIEKTSSAKQEIKSTLAKGPKSPLYDAVLRAYLQNDVAELVKKMPPYEKVYPTHLHTVFFKAWIADQTGNDSDGALRSYSEIIRKDSLFADAYAWRSKAFWNKGLDDRAITDITNAIRIQGANAPANYFTFRADYYNSAKNYSAAMADFKQAIRLAPSGRSNYIGVVNIASAAGQNSEAEQLLTTAIYGTQKDNADLHLVYGDFLLRNKRFKESDAVFTKALSMPGVSPTGDDYNNASVAAYKLKEYSKATVLSERAMTAAPKKEEFIFNRASIAIDLQRWEEVYQLAQKALSINANSSYANMLMAVGVRRTGRGDALSAEYEAKAKRLAAAGN